MKSIKIFSLTLFFVMISILSLIWNKYHSPYRKYSQQSCIPAKDSFAYEISYNIPLYPEKPVLPSVPWIVETEISYMHPELLHVMTSQNKEDIIWVKAGSYKEKHYYLYNVKRKVWSEVFYEQKELNGSIDIFKIFTDKDNVVWIFNVASNGQRIPMFSRYNAESATLSFDESSIDIPIGTQREIDVVLDSMGFFWILRSNDAIYTYDIHSQTIEKRTSLENQDISSAVLGLDGNIYFLDQAALIKISDEPANMYRRGAFYKYSIQANEISTIPYLLEPTPFPLSLLIDNSGSIWFDGLGWLNTKGKWYQVNKSPLFITTKIDGAGGQIYRWQTPRVVIKSSDGRLWFKSPNGMARLDPSKGEWCWFTTYQSNIVEDSDHNLWMIADNKLYKLPLDKQ